MNTHERIIKCNLIWDLLVRPADENYMTARFFLLNGIYNEFTWQAAHALEKYIKAALVLNGISIRNYSHNITKSYADLKKLASDLLPNMLVQQQDFYQLIF